MISFGRIKLFQGDITTLETDGIVNAANSSLQGGGGVDGAIHRKAGPELAEYNRIHLGKCKTGQAKMSPGFNLPAQQVIHTVGPVWQGGEKGEAELLSSCYRESLQIALAEGLEEIAFPSISTGIYGFPIEEAAPLAVRAVRDFLRNNSVPKTVIFVCFSEADHGIYRRILEGSIDS